MDSVSLWRFFRNLHSAIRRGRILWILFFLILASRPAEAKAFEHVQLPPMKGKIAVRSQEAIGDTGAVWSDSVQYTARSVDYRFDEDTILFSGDAKLRYGKMELTAEKITFRVKDDVIVAGVRENLQRFKIGVGHRRTSVHGNIKGVRTRTRTTLHVGD